MACLLGGELDLFEGVALPPAGMACLLLLLLPPACLPPRPLPPAGAACLPPRLLPPAGAVCLLPLLLPPAGPLGLLGTFFRAGIMVTVTASKGVTSEAVMVVIVSSPKAKSLRSRRKETGSVV